MYEKLLKCDSNGFFFLMINAKEILKSMINWREREREERDGFLKSYQ